jgi:molybdate transport system permease protein
MSASDWQIVAFTSLMAALATLAILPPGVTLAWFLARATFPGKPIVETLVALPLVIPPVATGLILLKLLGRKGPIGGFLHSHLDFDIVFTWRAVIAAMAVMSFPLLVRGARIAFESVDPRLEQVAATLGASPLRIFLTITLPLAVRGIIAGSVLAFARALGEFGATILVAGNIPGKTTTLSVSIYSDIQLGHDDDALRLLTVSILLAFAAVWMSEWLFKRSIPVA